MSAVGANGGDCYTTKVVWWLSPVSHAPPDLKLSLEQLPERQVVLDIEADPEELEASKKKAYQRLVGRLRIPGFRKGKAPQVMLERWIGKEALLEEAMNFLIPEVTDKAIKEQEIEAAGVPDIEVSGLDPVAWKATVPLTPTVDLGDYRGLRVEPELAVVPEEDITRALEDTRFNATPWEPASRPVEMGDLLTIDVAVEEAGKTITDQKDVQFRPLDENENPVPGFSQQLVGFEAGKEKSFAINFDASYENKDFAGRSFEFRVLVKEIKTKHLPEIDDEFAKGVEDGFTNLEALRLHLAGQLQEHADSAAREKLREHALDQLIEAATVEFPPTMVDHEAEHMLEEQARQVTQNQADVDAYVQAIGKDKAELIEEMKPAARERIVRSLIVTELKEAEKIEVEADEIDSEVESLIGVGGAEQREQLKRIFDTDANRNNLERSLLTRKTLDRLLEIATQDHEKAGADTAPALE